MQKKVQFNLNTKVSTIISEMQNDAFTYLYTHHYLHIDLYSEL